VIKLINMDILVLNKERKEKLCAYYSCQFTDEQLKNSVKVRYEAGEYVVLLVYVEVDFDGFKKNYIYFGDLKSCIDEILKPLNKNEPCKMSLKFCMDYFDANMNFLRRKERKKIEISVDI